jgi:hypothetical protein
MIDQMMSGDGGSRPWNRERNPHRRYCHLIPGNVDFPWSGSA